MDDEQQPDASRNRADAVPPFFAAFVPVKNDSVQGIGEYDFGKREIETVPGLVPRFPGSVPRKLDRLPPVTYIQH